MNSKFKRIPLYNTTSLKIFYLREGFILAEWDGFLNLPLLKEGLNALHTCIIEKVCFKVIHDHRKVLGTWAQALHWIEKEHIPRSIETGIKKVAFIYPPNFFIKQALFEVLEMNADYEAQVFTDFNEAVLWITESNIKDTSSENFLFVKTKDKHEKIPLNDIYYFSTHDGKVVIQTKDEQYITRRSLRSLLDSLPYPSFFRIHKSHIININRIKSLKYHAGGYYHLFIQDFGKVYLTVSKKQIKELKTILHLK